MVMQAMQSGKGSKFIKFIFFTLLVLAAFGLVLTDVGGFFRGGVSNNDVARVGNHKISVVEFDRSARRALARAGMQPAEAMQLGYMDQILNSEIQRSLFQQIAADNNIKIGRDVIAKQVNDIVEQSMQDGQSKQEVLDQLLRNQGFTEAGFVQALASEGAAGILARGIQNPFLNYSEYLVEDLFYYQNETRNIEYVPFLNKDVTDVEEPTDEQLEKLYNAMKPSFSVPETRDITVAIIDDSAISSTVSISDEDVREIYDEDIESFKVPEQRVLEQAIIKDVDQASEVYKKLEKTGNLKQAVIDATGDAKAYLLAQPFQKEGLIEDIADKVFEGDEVNRNFEPIQSPLGWHVIRLIKVNPPTTKSFDSVKEQIRKELLLDEQADQKYELASRIDDLLAGGATIEEVKQETKLELISVKDVTRQGAMASQHHPLDQFGDDQKIVTELAYEFYEGEASPVTEFSDGRLAFVQIDKTTLQSFKPFDDVKAEIKAGWIKDQRRVSNRNKVMELLNTASTESLGLEEIAKDNSKSVTKVENIGRNSDVAEPLSTASISSIFTTNVNDISMIEIQGGYAIAKITASNFPVEPADETEELETIKKSLLQSSSSEAVNSYYETMREDYKVVVNPSVLQRVYGSSDTQ